MGGGDGAGAVSIPVAVAAENEVVGGATNGDRSRTTAVTDLRTMMFGREGIGGVDMLVAE